LITRIGSRERTNFNYGFELTVGERPYLFFVNTHEELVNWTRMFRLIVEMNTRKLPVTLINPFDYEQLRRNNSVKVVAETPVRE
jgi:hypothetical protein